MRDRIVIVGGGFSGLVVADLLEHTTPATEILILEASERLGGRIETAPLGDDGLTFDAGAAEMYDIAGAPQLRRLIARLGLPTRGLDAAPTVFYGGRRIDDEGDLADVLGRAAAERLDAFWREIEERRPPADYARAGHPEDAAHPWSRCTFADVLATIGDPAAERFTAMQVHGDLAARPSETSGLFGVDNLLIDHPGYCRMFTIPGGNEQLTARLAEETRCARRLATPVRAVDRAADGGWHVRHGSGSERADAVVVTLPPQAVAAIDWSGAGVRDAVRGHVAHHSHPTAYLRVTVRAATRFWAETLPDSYFVSDAFEGVTVYDQSPDAGDADGPGVLSWLVAGHPAYALAELSDAEIVEAVLASAPPPLAPLRDRLVASRVDRWLDVRGVSRLPGGSPLLGYDARHRPVPGAPTLLFTGDHLYDATISGALDAAAKTVSFLLSSLGGAERSADDVLAAAGLRREEDGAPVLTGGAALPFLERLRSRA